MSHVTLRDRANRDVHDAMDWYESKRTGLGDEFMLTVADALAQIEETPLRFPIYYKDYRRAITDPYRAADGSGGAGQTAGADQGF